MPLAHFERLYADRPDPWRLDSSDYERDKYQATLAALPDARYRQGLEIGCANGAFTARLAFRCDRLLALEPVGEALARARLRNEAHPWVSFAGLFVPDEWPAGRFDLIVISEVLDYLGVPDVERLAERVCDALEPSGALVLVHWVGKKQARPRTEESTDRLLGAAGDRLSALVADRNADYRLDVHRRSTPDTVAGPSQPSV